MREYAKLSPTFWTGETGRAIRKRGSEAVIVALYLVSSPGSNMLGLYYQPIMYMAHETGLGIDGATKGLRACIEVGFCDYDGDTEMVFVKEMAAWQIADDLKPADLRCKGIQKDYEALPDNPFLEAWWLRYRKAFHLTSRRVGSREATLFPELPEQGPMEAPSEASSKPGAGAGAGAEKPSVSGRGSRLPPNWDPGEAGLSFAAQQGLASGRAQGELAKFRDYWVAQPGQKGVRNDWQATWRNWVRKAVEGTPQQRGAPSAADPFAGSH